MTVGQVLTALRDWVMIPASAYAYQARHASFEREWVATAGVLHAQVALAP